MACILRYFAQSTLTKHNGRAVLFTVVELVVTVITDLKQNMPSLGYSTIYQTSPCLLLHMCLLFIVMCALDMLLIKTTYLLTYFKHQVTCVIFVYSAFVA